MIVGVAITAVMNGQELIFVSDGLLRMPKGTLELKQLISNIDCIPVIHPYFPGGCL